jgi:hypothetical protein
MVSSGVNDLIHEVEKQPQPLESEATRVLALGERGLPALIAPQDELSQCVGQVAD